MLKNILKVILLLALAAFCFYFDCDPKDRIMRSLKKTIEYVVKKFHIKSETLSALVSVAVMLVYGCLLFGTVILLAKILVD